MADRKRLCLVADLVSCFRAGNCRQQLRNIVKLLQTVFT